MIARVTRAGIELASDAVLRDAQKQFSRDCCIRLPGFLPSDLVEDFQQRIAASPFERRVHYDVKTEPLPVDLVMRSDANESRFIFLLNDQRLFDFVERISGCDPIGSYIATVYKMIPGCGHADAWHSDDDQNRMVAMSLNLSAAPYAGGVLQIRNWRQDRLVHEVHNTGPGDAIVFLIADDLEHRVTEVTGVEPKIALAGWFQRTPVYRDKFPRRPH